MLAICVSDGADMVSNDYFSFLFKRALVLLFPQFRDTVNIKLGEEGNLQLSVQKVLLSGRECCEMSATYISI